MHKFSSPLFNTSLVFLPRLFWPTPAACKGEHRAEYTSVNTSSSGRGGTAPRTRSSYPHTMASDRVRKSVSVFLNYTRQWSGVLASSTPSNFGDGLFRKVIQHRKGDVAACALRSPWIATQPNINRRHIDKIPNMTHIFALLDQIWLYARITRPLRTAL